ncbi:MAG: helix-turn-helix domain-containing protein [Candidatus Thermoplasmatota archaeon]|nr:helix-turn-helix domain-containing protein [Candidatus Thermoplasmatota archaeon]
MLDDEIEALLDAIENSTRREILRELTSFSSYGTELSRLVGVSQQAINKHLFLLERANLIRLVDDADNSRRKVYIPSGSSSLIIDYSRNFFTVTKKDIYEGKEDKTELDSKASLIDQLREVEGKIDAITEERMKLLRLKDKIMEKIHSRLNLQPLDPISRKIITEYIECLDVDRTAEIVGMPSVLVEHILSLNNLKDILSNPS